MTNIFEPRENLYPFEYPHLTKFDKAIRASFWDVEHFNYDKDVRDFKIDLTENQKLIVERSMLSIGVVENKVKTFWARIDQRIPKVEVADVGHTFGGNEVIHAQAYRRLLDELNLTNKFENIMDVECMSGRVKYLTKYLEGVNSKSNKEFTKSLILFTLLVENVSLFSQFLIVSSFAKYSNKLNNFAEVINATAREEIIHGKFGSELIKLIKKENPEWFDDEMEEKVRRSIRKAYKAEIEVLDWIFEKGELDWISKEEIGEFLKYRLNDSLEQIEYLAEYSIDEKLLEKSNYLERMLLSSRDFDFFHGKNTDYNKNNSYTEDNLWD